jgi:septal ring factor EnvC (AmiA/AmiB activator)
MTTDLHRLETIVGQITEAVIATTETVERLAERVDVLAAQVQTQGQQQSYQIFALSEALQTLVDSQTESKQQIAQLTEVLQDFVKLIPPQSSINYQSF